MSTLQAPKIRKLADSSRVEFGPLAFYHPLIADGDTPVRTGIQTSAPGYVAPMHFHPYVELLFIIEGEAEAWLQGGEDKPSRLPVGTGIQTSAPGFVAPMHFHPYVELLFIIEGEAEVWLQGEEDKPSRLGPGDCVALPAAIPKDRKGARWG